jgi:endonuclease G
MKTPLLLLLTLLTTASVVDAHPSGLNAEGCHTNRKTDEYHCHHSSGTVSAGDGVSTEPSLTTPASTVTRSNNILKLDYEGFTVWLDCKERAAVKFRYNAQRDTGSFKRYDSFMLDPNVPAECQQFSDKAYGHGYDRGHQVPANHLDYSNASIKQSNYMTNIFRKPRK